LTMIVASRTAAPDASSTCPAIAAVTCADAGLAVNIGSDKKKLAHESLAPCLFLFTKWTP
jgi:hypothetical protein